MQNKADMMNWIALAMLAGTLAASCTARHGIERSNRPMERVDVEVRENNQAMVRHLYCDIHAEDMGIEGLQKITASPLFENRDFSGSVYRFPKLNFFQIIIRNTGREVITAHRARLSFGTTVHEALDIEKFGTMTKSPAYRIIDYPRLFSPRRLMGEKYSSRDIQYERDTLEYGFSFIPPSDTVLFFAVFDWIPVEVREFRLSVEFTVDGKSHRAEFNFTREEFRSSGEHFGRPRKKIDAGL